MTFGENISKIPIVVNREFTLETWQSLTAFELG